MARGNVIKREDLAKEMVENFNQLTKRDALNILNWLTERITSALKSGMQVKIAGLGTFKVRGRKARAAINPKTGEKITVEAKRVPKFTPAKDLKEAIK